MKFAAVFLLVTVMICCDSAAAVDPCISIDAMIATFAFGTHDEYMKATAPFATTPAMKDAASKLNKCVQKVPLVYRKAKVKIMENANKKCS